MNDGDTKQPVVDALTAIARSAGRSVLPRDQVGAWYNDSNHDLAIFSYARDFSRLWGLEVEDEAEAGLKSIAKRLAGSSKNGEYTLLIIWDDIPKGKTGAVGTARYLTPIDWTVAFSLSVDQVALENDKSGVKEYPNIRILILDLASQKVANADSIHFVRDFPKRGVLSMPWVRLFRPAVRDGEEWDAENLIAIITSSNSQGNGQATTIQTVFAKPIRPDLDIVKRYWSASLVKPSEADDHHALANLIGPLLLMGDSARDDANVRALQDLMRAVGLLRREDEGGVNVLLTDDNPWLRWESDEWQKKLGRLIGDGKKLKLLLIDDQWPQGWGEVICKAVGVAYKPPGEEVDPSRFLAIGETDFIEVKAVDSAKWLLNKLKEGACDQRFTLTLDDDKDGQEVLFLDLRLFSGKPIKDEADFIESLLEIAQLFPATDYPEKLPWSGFNGDECSRIASWVIKAKQSPSNSLRNDPRYHEALTLLPRILSLIDLSYPVILFSSTGQRNIIEHFKDYGNIITDFDKPRLTGALASDLAGQCMTHFQIAIGQSLSLLQARSRCQAFFNAEDPYDNANTRIPKNRAYHVEFYIDETDPEQHIDGRSYYRKGWRVGGCYALFDGDTEEEAIEKADQFEDMLVQNGIRYFEWKYNGVQPTDIRAKKHHVCHTHIRESLKEPLIN